MKGFNHVMENFNFTDFEKTWVNFMTEVHEENGSWETRKNYNGIALLEVA